MKKIYTFYSKLNAQSEEEIDFGDDFFSGLAKIKSDSCAVCEGKITNGECIAAMKEIASNKSPGNDGLSVEFFIGNLVVDSVNSAFGKKVLSSSQKQAVISLIHKEGKDPLFIKIL